MYSSGNSYILSAIVQKVSGMSCDLYLKENMTNQMGCGDFTWMKSPEGICSGGNGAMLCVEDMAAIGQVYLDRGLWNGKRLLCEEWVDLALGKKKPTPREKGEPEYNFHWRHSEKGIWVSRGMFGQVCCLIPELNMTAAFTAADKKYAGGRLFQECIVYPALAVEKKAEADAVNDGGKVARILRLYASRMTLEGKPEHAIRPKPFLRRYRAEALVDTITEAAIEVTDQELLFSIRDERGIHTVRHGLNTWKHGVTSMTGRYLHHQYEFASMKISAQASWMDKDHLLLEWRYPEMAFFDTVQIAFSGDGQNMYEASGQYEFGGYGAPADVVFPAGCKGIIWCRKWHRMVTVVPFSSERMVMPDASPKYSLILRQTFARPIRFWRRLRSLSSSVLSIMRFSSES